MKNKRFISMILAITLILGIVPTNVFATQGDTYSIDNVYSEYEKDADTDDYEEELGGETDENSNENAELSSYRQQSAFSVFMQEKMVEYKSLKEAQSTEDENSTEEANPPQATLSVMPIAGNEAEITGGSTYTTLEAAVTDATSGDTIKLLADVELELALSISEEITLDLNGFDIKQTEEYSVISITSSGNLTLEDNGSRADRYGYWDTSSGDYAIVANEADVPTDTDYTELQGGVIYGGIGTQSGSYKYGGGVYVTGGTFTMDGGNIAGNTARSGGGVYVENSGTFTMDGGTIAGNTATTNGMGVYISSSTFTMERGTISGNKTIGTSSSYGGGVYVYSSSTFTMNDGTISDNKTSYGGGVFISTSSTFAMKKGSIENNTASYGGVYVSSSSTFTMEDGIISYNTARSGGGVYVSDGTFIMEGGTG
ncbi:MAG: right-handed parallel beta-helix repeat-containing protein [Clostridia bacterium]